MNFLGLDENAYERMVAFVKDWWSDPQKSCSVEVPVNQARRYKNIIREIFRLHYGVESVRIDIHYTVLQGEKVWIFVGPVTLPREGPDEEFLSDYYPYPFLKKRRRAQA